MTRVVKLSKERILKHVQNYLLRYWSVGKERICLDICSTILASQGIKLPSENLLEYQPYEVCRRLVLDVLNLLYKKGVVELDDFTVNVIKRDELEEAVNEILKQLQEEVKHEVKVEGVGEATQTLQQSRSSAGVVEGLRKKVVVKKGGSTQKKSSSITEFFG